MFHFYTPWKNQKTFVFLFLEGTEVKHWKWINFSGLQHINIKPEYETKKTTREKKIYEQEKYQLAATIKKEEFNKFFRKRMCSYQEKK